MSESKRVMTEKPLNAETPTPRLRSWITANDVFFDRNQGQIPDQKMPLDQWELRIDGEVKKSLHLTFEQLCDFPKAIVANTLECSGNGRSLLAKKASGNPWTIGGVGNAIWGGVGLGTLLAETGLTERAAHVSFEGMDTPLGKANIKFVRSIPIDKAMEEHTLVAYRMNGKPLHALNGYPVRVVVPGWIGSASEKWLERIWVRDQVHDSKKMSGYSYRIPRYPVVPGSRPPEQDMKILTAWQVKSLITAPAADSKFNTGKPIAVRGHAWAGDNRVDDLA